MSKQEIAKSVLVIIGWAVLNFGGMLYNNFTVGSAAMIAGMTIILFTHVLFKEK